MWHSNDLNTIPPSVFVLLWGPDSVKHILAFVAVSLEPCQVDSERQESGMLWMIQHKLFIKNGGHFIWSSRDHRDKKKKKNYNPGQSGLDCETVGGGTRCSSILLDWERRMRLKKSSSGTVGPAGVADGAAHLWSSSLEPWNGVTALATKSTLELAHGDLLFLSHLTFDKHVKKHIIALRLLSFCFTVLGRRVCAGGRGCVEKRDQFKWERGISVERAEMGWPAGRTGSVLEVECVRGGLEVLRRKPGKWLRLTRWSSRRRAWELASSSRKWPGSCNGVSRSKIAKNR